MKNKIKMLKRENNTIINKFFKTPLGNVYSGIKSDKKFMKNIKKDISNNIIYEVFYSNSFKIELYRFNPMLLKKNIKVFNAIGFFWKVTKINDNSEKLNIFCYIEKEKNVESEISPGENMLSIELDNEDWILNIGTEDEDQNPKWKYDDNVKYFQALFGKSCEYVHGKNSFEFNINKLKKGESEKVHYIVAYNKQKDNRCAQTWNIVDLYDIEIEKYIKNSSK